MHLVDHWPGRAERAARFSGPASHSGSAAAFNSTNRIVGRVAASAIASATRSSFFSAHTPATSAGPQSRRRATGDQGDALPRKPPSRLSPAPAGTRLTLRPAKRIIHVNDTIETPVKHKLLAAICNRKRCSSNNPDAAALRAAQAQFTALLHHVDTAALERAFRRQSWQVSAGIDGMTVAMYEQDLGPKETLNKPGVC